MPRKREKIKHFFTALPHIYTYMRIAYIASDFGSRKSVGFVPCPRAQSEVSTY